eukprot:2201695-Amphidinium_carterae.1
MAKTQGQQLSAEDWRACIFGIVHDHAARPEMHNMSSRAQGRCISMIRDAFFWIQQTPLLQTPFLAQ